MTQRSSCVTVKKAKCSLRGKRKGRFHFTVLASVEDVEGLCCKPKYRADIIHHFILVCCLHFFYLFSCRKDQFTVLILKFDIEDFTDPGLLKIQLTLTGLSLWLLSKQVPRERDKGFPSLLPREPFQLPMYLKSPQTPATQASWVRLGESYLKTVTKLATNALYIRRTALS